MTKDLVALTILSASGAPALYAFYRRIERHISSFWTWVHSEKAKAVAAEQKLVAGLKAEFSAIHSEIAQLEQAVADKTDNAVEVLQMHAAGLKAHSEDLRNHAKLVHDEAQASKQSVVRSVPTR